MDVDSVRGLSAKEMRALIAGTDRKAIVSAKVSLCCNKLAEEEQGVLAATHEDRAIGDGNGK